MRSIEPTLSSLGILAIQPGFPQQQVELCGVSDAISDSSWSKILISFTIKAMRENTELRDLHN